MALVAALAGRLRKIDCSRPRVCALCRTLRWVKRAGEARRALQEELVRRSYAGRVRWDGYRASVSVGFGAVLSARGEVTDREVVIEHCGGALGARVLRQCQAVLEQLFPPAPADRGGNCPRRQSTEPRRPPGERGTSVGHEPKSWVSILVTIHNDTGCRLVRASMDQSSGVYTVEPPMYIDDGEARTFCIESAGFMTGAIGTVTYKLEGTAGACQFDYSAPFIGPNRYGSTFPSGFYVDRHGGVGYAAQVQFVIRPKE
jgi:hypothetical protein